MTGKTTPDRLGLLLLFAMASCSDAAGLDSLLVPPDLVGRWTAISAVFTSAAEPTRQIDVVPLGFAQTVIIEGNAHVLVRTSEPGEAAEVTLGRVSVDGARLSFQLEGDPDPLDGPYEVEGDELRIALEDQRFEFSPGSASEAATLEIVFERSQP